MIQSDGSHIFKMGGEKPPTRYRVLRKMPPDLLDQEGLGFSVLSRPPLDVVVSAES